MNEPSVNYDVLSPVKFLDRSAAVYPEKTAVVYGRTRRTYREFQERVHRLANALKQNGIGKGDKVAFICPNTPPLLEAHYAVPMIGAAMVSITFRLSANEVGYIIEHSDAKAVFADNEFAPTVQPVIGTLNQVQFFVNICDTSAEAPLPGTDYESFLASGTADPVEIAVTDEREVAAINYTSGTTGRPKGVMYHHRGAYLNAIGEIVMRGNNVMLGYYKDPEATRTAFDGGWFRSGDLAVMHPDGYAQIMDRKKDIIISGGENISTVEIENVIFQHPDVLEVAVIPVPDPK